MNRNSEATSVDATLKVSKVYGKSGLLRALTEGQSVAHARAAFRLRDFSDADVARQARDALSAIRARTTIDEK